MPTAHKLWCDEQGFIVSIELILLATISIIGLIAGLTSVRDSVICELADVAGAVQDLNQCYSFNGITGHSATTCGSDYIDATDWCDNADDNASEADNCIVFTEAPEDEESGGGGGTLTSGTGIGTPIIIIGPRPPLVIGRR